MSQSPGGADSRFPDAIERWAAPLLRLFRDRSNSIEQRTFQGITLTTGLLCLLVVVPLNIIQKLPPLMVISAGALGLITLGLFFATLHGFYGMKTLFLLAMIDLDLSWFNNGGSQGSIGLFFFPAAMYLVIFFKGLTRWFLLSLYLANGLGLLWLEWVRPGWIWPFPNPWSRVLDLGTGFIVCSVMCVVILWMVLASYHRERQRLAESLEAQGQSEARFRALIMQAPVPITLASAQGRIEYVNRAFEQVLGYSLEDLPDVRTWWEKAYPDAALRERASSHWAELIRRAMATGASVRPEEHQVTARDGRSLHLEIQAANIGGQWLVMFTDVSERRRSEEAMRQTQKLESLGVLAGGIAHDFNNLLSAMLGNLNLAQMKQPVGAASGPYLENMEGTILKAAELTRQMLAYSGKGRFVVEPLDLNRLVGEITHLLTVSISKRVVVDYQLDADLPTIEADAAQIQQIIMNLVTNASESIGESNGHITVGTSRREILARDLETTFLGQNLQPGSYVTLWVEDSGSGMEPGILSRIFDPFFSTKGSGRGLGLSAMLGILRGHQAGIEIQSEPGQGSRFEVHFRASEAEVPAPVLSLEPRQPRFQGRILLVDDEPELRFSYSSMLAHLGFQVVAAKDGVEALERFQAGHFVLVFMDLTMPRMDGRQAFQRMKTLDPEVCVILASGYSQGEAVDSMQGLRPAAFIQKPFSFQAMTAVLEQVLG